MPLSIRVANQVANMAASLQEADEQISALAEQVNALTKERDELLALLPDDVRATREKRTATADGPIVLRPAPDAAPKVEAAPAPTGSGSATDAGRPEGMSAQPIFAPRSGGPAVREAGA